MDQPRQAPGRTAGADTAFGEFLVAQGVLRAEQVRPAIEVSRSAGGRLDTSLLELGVVSENALLDALGQFHDTRTVGRDELVRVPPEVARMVSPRMAERLQVVPFWLEGRTLHVATVDPSDLLIEDELSLLTDCRIASFVTLEVRLAEALLRLYAITPSIQVSSALNRMHDREGRATGARHATRTMAREPATAEVEQPLEAATSAEPHWESPVDQTPRTDALALDISQEDLEQFPSLRQEILGATEPELRLHARPPDRPAPPGHDERLGTASAALQNAEMREDIADALLAFCAPILRRRLMLAVRGDSVVGWRGEGEGVDPGAVRDLVIPLADPSVFVGLVKGTEFWLGPLPRMARNQDLVRTLGGTGPNECIILPLIVRSKTVCFLYGDNIDGSVSGLPISHLRRLVGKASLAFQVYLLKSKIRNL